MQFKKVGALSSLTYSTFDIIVQNMHRIATEFYRAWQKNEKDCVSRSFSAGPVKITMF